MIENPDEPAVSLVSVVVFVIALVLLGLHFFGQDEKDGSSAFQGISMILSGSDE